jgi:hypothetical protein
MSKVAECAVRLDFDLRIHHGALKLPSTIIPPKVGATTMDLFDFPDFGESPLWVSAK